MNIYLQQASAIADVNTHERIEERRNKLKRAA
jgi:hypothetical protein